MKYLSLMFVLLSGCATTNSEYWHGCIDATQTIVENSNFTLSEVSKFCDSLQEERDQKQAEERFRVPGRH